MKIVWNRVTWYSKLFAVILFVGVFVLGLYLGAVYNEAQHQSVGTMFDGQSAATARWNAGHKTSVTTKKATVATKSTTQQVQPVQTTVPVAAPAPVLAIPTPSQPAVQNTVAQSAGETVFSAYITAYTYWDNTPPGSFDISNPIIHQKAGGVGTYNDPITVAVGHSFATGSDVLDYPAGTKFYLPYIKKYFIVEDTCGDGSTPQNGPCHTGYQGHPWLDLWIDGATGTRASTNTCAENLTDIHTVIQNPAANYAVVSGQVYNNGCAQKFSETPVTN